MLTTIARYYHTLKYLKPVQLLGWVYFFMPRWIQETKNVPPLHRLPARPVYLQKRFSTPDFNAFTFLNESYPLNEAGWDNEAIAKLWRYHLHYFDYLNSVSPEAYAQDHTLVARVKALIHQWIQENPFGKGTAWEPYPTSLRMVNWVKWMQISKMYDPRMVQSLWNQLRWLSNRPEYHLRGNHLLANAKAMIIGSLLFTGNKAEGMFQRGLRLFRTQLKEQFLSDGAHIELSPMYHAIALEDLLEVYVLAADKLDQALKKELEHTILHGLDWLSAFTYQDGTLAYFNDVAEHQAPGLKELLDLAHRVGLKPDSEATAHKTRYFSDSGFVTLKNDSSYAILDIGKVGPDWLPGHAHADTLSFELAIRSERVFVNSGTSVYGTSQERHRQRSTSAHTTVEINHENSSEVWAGFRVARRAYPIEIEVDIEVELSDDRSFVKASHDGYHRLVPPITHSRSWNLDKQGLRVTDDIQGSYTYAISRFYLHPDIQVSITSEGLILSKNLSGKITDLAKVWVEAADGNYEIKLVDTTFHPEFGRSYPNSCITIHWYTCTQMSVCITSLV